MTGWEFAEGTLAANYRVTAEDGTLTVYAPASPAIPRTADGTASPLPLALAGAAMACLGCALLALRRREEEEVASR